MYYEKLVQETLPSIIHYSIAYYFTVGQEFYSNMIAELPASIDDLNSFGAIVTEEPEFVEVFTKSPRFGDIVECLPIFVVTGFRPERLNKIYEHLIYPTFEARLPEDIESIEDVATKLVQVNTLVIIIFHLLI